MSVHSKNFWIILSNKFFFGTSLDGRVHESLVFRQAARKFDFFRKHLLANDEHLLQVRRLKARALRHSAKLVILVQPREARLILLHMRGRLLPIAETR